MQPCRLRLFVTNRETPVEKDNYSCGSSFFGGTTYVLSMDKSVYWAFTDLGEMPLICLVGL